MKNKKGKLQKKIRKRNFYNLPRKKKKRLKTLLRKITNPVIFGNMRGEFEVGNIELQKTYGNDPDAERPAFVSREDGAKLRQNRPKSY